MKGGNQLVESNNSFISRFHIGIIPQTFLEIFPEMLNLLEEAYSLTVPFYETCKRLVRKF